MTQPATAETFNPTSTEHITALIRLHQAYLLEELDRIGHYPSGIPVARWLKTSIIRIGETPAGFISVDIGRHSVELLYIAPPYRGQGIAAALLAGLAATCPKPMELKTPLTPGGHALANKLGLGLAHSTPEELADNERAVQDLHRTINRQCTHRRVGNPARPCKRCYRRGLEKTAVALVLSYAAMQRIAA